MNEFAQFEMIFHNLIDGQERLTPILQDREIIWEEARLSECMKISGQFCFDVMWALTSTQKHDKHVKKRIYRVLIS
jgi:hypothetical protein